MNNFNKYKNKSFGVFGLGKTGVSTISFLREHATNIVVCWDDIKKRRNDIKKYGEFFQCHFNYWFCLFYLF